MNKFAKLAASALTCGALMVAGSTVAMAAPAVSASAAGSQVVATQQVTRAAYQNYNVEGWGSVTQPGQNGDFIIGGAIKGSSGHIRLGGKFFCPAEACDLSLSKTTVTPTTLTTTMVETDHIHAPVILGTGTLHSTGTEFVYSGAIVGPNGTTQINGLTLAYPPRA